MGGFTLSLRFGGVCIALLLMAGQPAKTQGIPSFPSAQEAASVYLLAREVTDLRSEPDHALPVSPESQTVLRDWLFSVKRTAADHLTLIAQGEHWRVLPGDVRTDYCDKISAGLKQGSGGKIRLRFDVAQARILVDALAPELPDLISRIRDAQSPADVEREIAVALARRLSDSRVAQLLRLVMARPEALAYLRKTFALGEDDATLAQMAKLLSLDPEATNRWCGTPQRIAPVDAAIARARDGAHKWADALTRISAEDFVRKLAVSLENASGATLNKLMSVALETGVPSLDLNPKQPACKAPWTECWSVALQLEPSERASHARGRLYLRRHSAATDGTPQEAVALFSTGITIDNIAVDRDLETPGLRYKVGSHPYLPTQPSIELDELRSGLRAIGLPRGLTISDAVPVFEPDLSRIGVNLTFDLPALGLRAVHYLPLIGAAQSSSDVLTNAVKTELDKIAKNLDAAVRDRLSKSGLSMMLAGSAQSLSLAGIQLESVENEKLDISASLSVPLVGEVKANFTIDPRATPIRAELGAASVPLEQVQRLQSQLRATADKTVRGSGDCVSLSGLDLVGGEPGRAALVLQLGTGDAKKSFELSTQHLGELVQAVASQTGLDLRTCLADHARRLAKEELAKALDALKQAQVSLFGIVAKVEAARSTALTDGVRILLDLRLEAAQAKIQIANVALKASWKPGSLPTTADLDLSTATLKDGDDARRLLLSIAPAMVQLSEAVSIERLHWQANGPVLTMSFAVKGLGEKIRIENLVLDSGKPQAVILAALNAAALAYVESMTGPLFTEALKEIGPVKKISLVSAQLFPPNGPPRLSIRADIEAAGITIPLLVALLPSFDVKVESSAAMKQSLLGFVEKYLGGLLGSNGPISEPRTIADAQARKYGVAFDVNLEMLGGLFPPGGIQAKGFEITNRGVNVPTAYTVPVPQPPIPIPPAFFFNNARITVYTKPPATFAAGGDIVLQADPQGAAVALRGMIRASAAEKTIGLDASLLVLSIPFATAVGTLDFGRNRVDAKAVTVDPIAKLLDLQSELHFDGRAGTADMQSLVKVLGMQLSQFQLQLRGLNSPANAQAFASGSAQLPGVAGLQLVVNAKADLSRASAEGRMDFVNGKIASGSIKITPAVVDTRFRALGVGIRLVVRTVSILTPKLIEDIIKRLLDFDPSFDFSKAEIAIVLVDSNGNEVDSEVGGGDAVPATAQPGDAGGVQTADPKRDEKGGGVTVAGGQGDGTILSRVLTPKKANDLCRDSAEGEWEAVAGLDGHVMDFDHRERGKTNVIYFSSSSRLASEAVLSRLDEVAKGQAKVLACFPMSELKSSAVWQFAKHGINVQSSTIAVIARGAGLEALVFQFGKQPVPIPLRPGLEQALFGASLKEAQANGWRISPLGLPILAFLAAEAVETKDRAIKVDRIIPLDDALLPAEWKRSRLAVLRDVGTADRTRMIAVSDQPLTFSRRRGGQRPFDDFLGHGTRSSVSDKIPPMRQLAMTLSPDNPVAKLAEAAPSLLDRVMASGEANDFRPEFWLASAQPSSECVLVRASLDDRVQLLAVKGVQLGHVRFKQNGRLPPEWRDDKDLHARLCAAVLVAKNGLAVAQADEESGRAWLALSTADEAADPNMTGSSNVHLIAWAKNAKVGSSALRQVDALRTRLMDWLQRQAVTDAAFAGLQTYEHLQLLLDDLVAPNGVSTRFRANARGIFN